MVNIYLGNIQKKKSELYFYYNIKVIYYLQTKNINTKHSKYDLKRSMLRWKIPPNH